jgi:phosphopantetheinyl transferase
MGAIVLHAALVTGAGWAWQARLLQALPYAKRLDLERREEAAQRASLAGIALALLGAGCLRGAAVPVAEIAFPTGGKPSFKGGPWFSISHTPDFVCCALSADVELGLDVETGGPRDDSVAAAKLWRWTATEATLKAAGLGLRHTRSVTLAADLASASLHDVSYRLQALALQPGIVCHLASPLPTAVHIEAVDLAAPAVSAALERCFSHGAQLE